jgi:hypothetical protein
MAEKGVERSLQMRRLSSNSATGHIQSDAAEILSNESQSFGDDKQE